MISSKFNLDKFLSGLNKDKVPIIYTLEFCYLTSARVFVDWAAKAFKNETGLWGNPGYQFEARQRIPGYAAVKITAGGMQLIVESRSFKWRYLNIKQNINWLVRSGRTLLASIAFAHLATRCIWIQLLGYIDSRISNANGSSSIDCLNHRFFLFLS